MVVTRTFIFFIGLDLGLPPLTRETLRQYKCFQHVQIIGLAKKQGLIASAREVFEVLHRSDFRISAAVINQVLVSVKE